jgi:hypothetical protein
MVVIYLIAAWWLAANDTGGLIVPSVPRMIVGSLILVQAAVGLFAWEQDIARPFSQARNAAAWIKQQGLNTQPLVVNGYIAGPALSVYLGKKLWYLNTGEEGSFCLWRRPYFPIPERTVAEEMAASPFLPRLDSFVLLSSKALGQQDMSGFRFLSLQNFRDGILPMEDCYIYEAKRTVNH